MEKLYSTPRYTAIDVLRGLIMVIMALDHVRDFFHIEAVGGTNPLDLTATTPALFFTRWITHFCAPIFVFLSGLSAAVSTQYKGKKAMAGLLVRRGLWLVLVEIVVMNFIITFNPAYNLLFLLVLWAIGWSMVILGLLIWLPLRWVVALGIILFAGHNILDHIALPDGGANAWLRFLLTASGNFIPLGEGRGIILTYAILPWTGIMLLGYGAGNFYKNNIDIKKRKKWLYILGMSLLLLFVVLRLINVYGDPAPWSVQRNTLFSIFSFVNVTKYPVSLQFGCLTIGAGLLLLAFFENKINSRANWLMVYGRVPFLYYVCHFLLIHLLCAGAFLTFYPLSQAVDPASPFLFRPASFGFSLPWVYATWIVVVAIMYYPCHWYGKYKAAHRYWWLSYL